MPVYWKIGIWLFFVAACVGVVVHTRFSADLTAFLPRSPVPAQKVLVEQLRHGSGSRIILLAVEGGAQERLASVSKDLSRRLSRQDAFAAVKNGENARIQKERSYLWHNRYLLSPDVTSRKFSPIRLRQALESDLEMLESPASMLIKDRVGSDPTGEFLHLLKPFNARVGTQTRDGVWFSADGRRALLVVQTKAPASDIDSQKKALTVIRNAFRQSNGSPGLTLLESGPGVFSVHIRDQIHEDARRFFMVASLLVSGLLLASYRSFLILGLALVPVASGVLAGVAAVSVGFGLVHGITLGFGATLIGEAVDYAIYLFTQTTPESPPEKTLSRIWPTLSLGVSTSICGFSALLFSDFSELAQLGLFSIAGLLVAVSVTRWVLPSLLPDNFSPARLTMLGPMVLFLGKSASRLRYPLLLGVVSAAFFIGLQHGKLWGNLSDLSPVSHKDQKLEDDLERDIGAPDARFLIVVSANSAENALITSEKIAVLLRKLEGKGIISGFDFPARYLPSQASQRARQAALPTPMELRSNLDQALVGLPFHKDIFDPFVREVADSKTRRLLDRASLEGTDLELALNALLIQHDRRWEAIISLRGVKEPRYLSRSIAQFPQPDVVFLDLKEGSNQIYRNYLHETLTLSLTGALVIVFLLAVSLGKMRRVYSVLAPLAAAVITTTALLVGFGQKLTIFNLVGLLLVVAIGSNYSLFFERQNASSRVRERTISSLVLANLSTVIGFGTLSFSRIPILHGIGATVGIGAFLSLVFSAVLTARDHPDEDPSEQARRA